MDYRLHFEATHYTLPVSLIHTFFSADVVTIWYGINVFGERTDVEDPTCLVIFFFPPRKTHFFVKGKDRKKKKKRTERESKEYDLKITPHPRDKKKKRKDMPKTATWVVAEMCMSDSPKT